MEFHGDEDEIEAEYRENLESYNEANADNWKYEDERS